MHRAEPLWQFYSNAALSYGHYIWASSAPTHRLRAVAGTAYGSWQHLRPVYELQAHAGRFGELLEVTRVSRRKRNLT